MGKQDNYIAAEGPSDEGARRQSGALCWRMRGAKPEVLLITSRDTGRWVIPKGWPIRSLSLAESAAVEAWEEAGVKAEKSAEPLGIFHYQKGLGPDRAVPCQVEVFSLRVDRLAEQYPEKGQRRRKWFAPAKAAKKVEEPELRQLILGFAPFETEKKAKVAS